MVPPRIDDVAPPALHAWEAESSFQDQLASWLERTPWLALSLIAHALGFAILFAIPWQLLRAEEPTTITAQLEQTVEDPFVEDPLPEEPEELEDVEVEEPLMQDADVDPTDEPLDRAEDSGPASDLDLLSEETFDSEAFQGILGLGGGDLGGLTGRFGRGTGGDPPGGRGTRIAVQRALDWLRLHQSPDGSWDCDGFEQRCGSIGSTVCGGAGESLHDVGVTGLALLAFLGDGNTPRHGPHQDVVRRAVRWLVDQQDPDTGLIGQALGSAFVYDHAIGTLALCEAYYLSGSPLLRTPAKEAAALITRARNPYGAWRYALTPDGESDTSVTGWMVFALKSAADSGLVVDERAFQDALTWLDEVSDPRTGRAGYQRRGEPSSRIRRVNDHFPTESGEAMTAVALLCRFFLGQDPREEELMKRHADLLLERLPEWDPDGFGNDMYYWYYGTYAMYQMSGRHWAAWNGAMKRAVRDSQRMDGDERGSWDPSGPWGFSGGRVASTAFMTLCLEVYYRYDRVLGAR